MFFPINESPNEDNTVWHSEPNEYGVVGGSGILTDLLPFGPNYPNSPLPKQGWSHWVFVKRNADGTTKYRRANYTTGTFEYYDCESIY